MRKLYSKGKYIVFLLLQDLQESQVQPGIDVKFELCKVQEISKHVRGQIAQLQSYLYYMYLRLRYGTSETLLGLAWHDKKLAHASWIIPAEACKARYDFIPKGNYIIGPCRTSSCYKGQGIFPFVLQQLVSCLPGRQECWIFANEDNIASLKGISKAGAKKVGTFVHTRVLWGIFSHLKYSPGPK
jgi:hypothetical protein